MVVYVIVFEVNLIISGAKIVHFDEISYNFVTFLQKIVFIM